MKPRNFEILKCNIAELVLSKGKNPESILTCRSPLEILDTLQRLFPFDYVKVHFEYFRLKLKADLMFS